MKVSLNLCIEKYILGLLKMDLPRLGIKLETYDSIFQFSINGLLVSS